VSESKSAKTMLAERLDKTVSREMAAIVLGGFGLLEGSAPPELVAAFSAVVILILQLAKVFDSFTGYKRKRGAVEAGAVLPSTDTQDTPTDGPSFG
jgi:hypothetical protein